MTEPLIVALAVVPDPPPPLKVTVGAELYPLPPLLTVTEVTWALMVAVAVAPDPPPPPEKVIVGAELYPLPPAVTLTDMTAPLIVEVAAAPDPPPPVKVTLGAEV